MSLRATGHVPNLSGERLYVFDLRFPLPSGKYLTIIYKLVTICPGLPGIVPIYAYFSGIINNSAPLSLRSTPVGPINYVILGINYNL